MTNAIELPANGGEKNTNRAIYIYMTVEQYAEHRQVCRTTVFNWINLGMPSIKQGRTRRVRVEVADQWLDGGNASLAHHVPKSRKAGGGR